MAGVVKKVVLVKVDSRANNNKFYDMELHDDSRVKIRWGRVGSDGQTIFKPGGEAFFNKTLNDKKKRGYTEVDVIDAPKDTGKSVGANGAEVAKAARSSLLEEKSKGNPELESLIDRLVAMNRHEIIAASGGLISVSTTGVVQTSLGIIANTALNNARQILDDIERSMARGSGRPDVTLLERYLTIVPQKTKRQRGWEENFFNSDNTVAHQRAFLDQLQASIKWYENEKKAAEKAKPTDDDDARYANLFQYKIDVLDPKTKEYKDIVRMYESTKKSSHTSSRLKVKRIFTLTDRDGDETYNKVLARIGNEKRLWHGTRAFNVLSILRRGLFVPPTTGGQYAISGRMFGSGVYLATASSKSLNYSAGYWSGTRENNCFMFLADVAMGNEYRPRSAHDAQRLNVGSNNKKSDGTERYDSIFVKGGTCGVINDEVIVWNTDQIRLRYLIEFAY